MVNIIKEELPIWRIIKKKIRTNMWVCKNKIKLYNNELMMSQ